MADRPYMCRDEGLFLPECDDCSQLEGRVKALEDCCETATEELADHEERISSAENTLTNHTQTLSEQNTRITANSNSISANTQSIGRAESEINSVKSRVTTAEGDIDTLQEDLMSAQSDIQSNTDAIDSIERLPEVTSADDGKVLTVVDGKWGIKPSSLVGEAIVGQSTVGGGQGGSVFDTFYPVGSYYETSDSTFDPNTAWGGTWVQETEQVRTASWIATSTNTNNAKVTDSLMLPAGTYIGWIKIPVCSQETNLTFSTNLGIETGGALAKGQSVVSFTFTLSTETEIYAYTNMSQATNYTYIERGYLKVARISSHIGSRWHRTA